MPFQHFPKENVIFKNARISIPTTRVFGKYPRVRQICPQMEKLVFLEIWKMNRGSAKATNHCGTFTCNQDMHAIAWPGRDLPRRCQIKPEELALVAEQVVVVALAPALHLHGGRPRHRTQHPGGEANPRRHHASTQQHGSHRLVANQSRQPAHRGLKA